MIAQARAFVLRAGQNPAYRPPGTRMLQHWMSPHLGFLALGILAPQSVSRGIHLHLHFYGHRWSWMAISLKKKPSSRFAAPDQWPRVPFHVHQWLNLGGYGQHAWFRASTYCMRKTRIAHIK